LTYRSQTYKIERMSILKHIFPPQLEQIYTESFSNQLAKTQASVVSLNQSRRLLQNPELLMKPILTKEAEASSRLEGTQASIEDVYKMDVEEQTDEKKQDISEIRNYEQAMLDGIDIIQKTKKLDNFTIRAIHKTLLIGVRGKEKRPGQFRADKVWVGSKGTNEEEARYVPPEATQVQALMEQLENYIRTSKEKDYNPLIACGVIHHRFEAIHPFKDGNGRTGRLLISLYLIYRGLLSEPMLYASGYFEENRKEYMDALSAVDKAEKWDIWLKYFLIGIEEQANKSLELSFSINDLYKKSEEKIKSLKSHLALLQALEECFKKPYITAPILSRSATIPISTSRKYLTKLKAIGVMKDVGFYKRQRIYVNFGLINILRSI